jgi:hypothetical protein
VEAGWVDLSGSVSIARGVRSLRGVRAEGIVLCIALLCAQASANAASIEVSRLNDGSGLVLLDGDIELDDVAQFWSKVAAFSKATVAFRSEGGSLLAGIRIGTLIRDRGFATLVPDGAWCASACAVAWLGGVQRLLGTDSKVGFHAAYVLKGHKATESGPGNAVLGAYLYQLGLSEDAIVYVTQADPSSIRWLNLEQAAQYGIDVALAPWAVQSASPTDPVIKPEPEEGLQRRATDFVLALASRWSSPNEEAFRSFDELYADKVRYRGKLTLRQDVVLDKHRFAERWPQRSYTIRAESISVTCAKESETCNVKGVMNRSLANGAAKTMSRDVTSFEYQIADSGQTLHIVAETSALAKPQSRARVLNPFTAVGQGIQQLLAKMSQLTARSARPRTAPN